MDREDFLAQALSHLNKDTFSEVELLLIDGFHDYTQLELKFIKELTYLIPNVYVTLPYQISDPVPPAFQVSHKTYSRLSELNLQASFPIGYISVEAPGKMVRKEPV